MTERTRLISYLLYGLFSAILKKNTMKTPETLGRGTKDGGHAENVLVVSLQFRSPSGG